MDDATTVRVYPKDEELLRKADNIVDGIDVHDRNQARINYNWAIEQYNTTQNSSYWVHARKYERLLRGIVLEAEMRRYALLLTPTP
jgi:hypothetical protein